MNTTGKRLVYNKAASELPWGRYLLVVLVPTLLLLAAFVVAVDRLQDEISFTQSELDGVHDISGIYQSVLLLQQMRGLDQLNSVESTIPIDKRLAELEQRLNEGLSVWMHESRSQVQEVEQRLRNLNFQLLSRSTMPDRGDAARRFAWFTRHIDSLQLSVTHIALHSRLMLDPEKESYLLANILFTRLPALTEALGRLRGVGAGIAARGKLSVDERIWLGTRLSAVREQLALLRQEQELINEGDADVAIALKEQFTTLARAGEEMALHFKQQITARTQPHTPASVLRLFDYGTGTIAHSDELFQAIHKKLEALLEQRIARLEQERLWLLLLFLLAFAGVLLSTSSFYRGQRKAMDSLHHTGAQLEAAQRIAGVGYWSWNLTAKTLEWSAELYRIFGWEPYSFPADGERMQQAIHPEDQPKVKRQLNEVLRTFAMEYQLDYRIVREDGTLRYLSESGEVVRNSRAKAVNMVGTVLDITERKLAELQNLQAREIAEQASRAKGMFLANMSHEIRTPMNAVINLSRLALQSQLPPRQHDYISKVLRAGEGLLGIINDILDYSKIEEGKLDIELIPFNLESVIEDLSEIVKYRIGEEPVELLLDLPPTLPMVVGDPMRLAQVLTNILSNGIKFTEQGEVVLRVEILVQHVEQLTLRFSVIDSGIGISETQQQRLFQPFEQADGSITRRFGGTGLGLAISRRLLELMNSELLLNSEEGKGSTFSFDLQLPLSKIDGNAPQTGFNCQHVLVVDDNASARQILVEMLQRQGCTADAVNSGEAALEQIADRGQNTPYDLLLIDWQLPGINGIETLQRLLDDNSITPTPRALLVTAFGASELREHAELAGFSGLLEKPFTPARLCRLLGGEGVLKENLPRHIFTEHMPHFAEQRVLVVEDNEINQVIANELLTKVGLEVVIAEDGAQALQTLRQQIFDLVLMDLQMPVMDGYEATRQIRAESKWDDMPVVAMTAHALKEEREHCLALGMNDHIAKPIDIDELHRVLRQWIKPQAKNN